MKRPRRCDFQGLPAAAAAAARGCRVVAFDVFDTLLWRHVAPDDVKELCAREFANRLGNPAMAPRLYQLRRELEVSLCDAARAAGHDHEFRHGDLVQRWVRTAAPDHPTLADELVAWELVCERLVTAPAPSAPAALAAVHATGVRTLWISDNYLPAAAIDGLLAAHGLRQWLHGGHVSSTELHTKRSGRLFADLLASESITAPELLVVGDTRHADRDPPSRLGARTLWVRDRAALARRRRLEIAHVLHRRHRFFAGHRLATAATFRVGRSPKRPAESAAASLGSLLGATFTSFALFVHQQARELGLDRVFFLSREGAGFLRLYRRVQQRLGEPGPPATYLCASRRSTFLPSLPRLDARELGTRLWRHYPHQSVDQLLADLSLPAVLRDVAMRHGIADPAAPSSHPGADPRMRAFLADDQVQSAFTRAHDTARLRLSRYLESKRMPDSGTVGIVDIGWKGSIQSNLARCLPHGSELRIEGLYLALAGGDDDGPHSRKRGYVFDHRRDAPHAGLLLQVSQVFEMFASARHGAVVGYGERFGRPRPILAAEAAVAGGDWLAVRRACAAAVDDLLPAVDWLRPGASELLPWLHDRIHRYVHHPTLAEARAALAFGHEESFGTARRAEYAFPRSWRHILFAGPPWRILARASAAFATQEWPGAALRRSRVPGACFLYDHYRSLAAP